jgi:hypothetical protein
MNVFKTNKKIATKMLRIAVDFGGVLSIHDKESVEQNSNGEAKSDNNGHRSTAINMPDSIESLRLLKDQGHKLFLNSFCGKARALETQKGVDEQTPGLFEKLYFVKNKKFKGDVTKFLGCDVMIDDTLEILVDMAKSNSCPNLIWFTGDPNFDDKTKNNVESIKEAKSWKQIVELVSSIKPTREKDESVNLKSKLY